MHNTFCSSPWFHLRLTYNGDFGECRWFVNQGVKFVNVANTSIMEFYNHNRMRELRTELLNGNRPSGCVDCYYQDQFKKLNGRTRQLLKSGIRVDNFTLTARSSPHYPLFLHSQINNGQSDYHPVDLQIDLGNVCNSACIMCEPIASSRLHNDFKKLHKITPTLFKDPAQYSSWTHDPVIVNRVVDEIVALPNLKYIHFLGGETLYDETFYTICEKLISSGKAKNIIIGTTTNGTIYDQRVENLIKEFQEFHLGISIESVTHLNDYIRYPGKINVIRDNIDKFLALRDNSTVYVSLRITPNVFTVSEIDLMFEYMIEKNVTAESCNILSNPESLRMELLPENIRQDIINKLDILIKKYNFQKTDHPNVRRADIIPAVIANLILEYYQFVSTYTVPDNVEELRKQLVDFIKAFESIRHNSILDYVPNYEKFLRSYGY